MSPSVFKIMSSIATNKNGKTESPSKLHHVNIDEHLMTINEVAARYGTDLNYGLTSEQVREKSQQNGLNQLTPPKKTPEIIKFAKLMFSGFSMLLWVGAALCIISYFITEDQETVRINDHFRNLFNE